MVSEEKAKATALIVAVSVIVGSVSSCSQDWTNVGVAAGCGLLQRVAYSFFHANLFHAIVNAWCLLSVVFLFPVSVRRLMAAFLVAVCVPDFCLSDAPTVGLSCVCYALLGSVSLMASNRAWWILCIAFYIGIGFLFPHVNALVHLYGYLVGLLVGLLTTPVCRWIKRN